MSGTKDTPGNVKFSKITFTASPPHTNIKLPSPLILSSLPLHFTILSFPSSLLSFSYHPSLTLSHPSISLMSQYHPSPITLPSPLSYPSIPLLSHPALIILPFPLSHPSLPALSSFPPHSLILPSPLSHPSLPLISHPSPSFLSTFFYHPSLLLILPSPYSLILLLSSFPLLSLLPIHILKLPSPNLQIFLQYSNLLPPPHNPSTIYPVPPLSRPLNTHPLLPSLSLIAFFHPSISLLSFLHLILPSLTL